uniref:Uncharacterized protein n=1 Tax=Oryza barthii TaxID=65489 RepID=A0A0D3F0M5_9ORYZ
MPQDVHRPQPSLPSPAADPRHRPPPSITTPGCGFFANTRVNLANDIWDVGSGRCSGCGDDCFFLGWEPPFADLAAADARISFHVCVPEDLWDASSSRNSDRARPIPATFSVMYGKVGISADTHPQFYLRLFLQ